MRICIPLRDSRDASSGRAILAEHFGQAERFGVLDSELGEVVAECAVGGYCKGPCACPLPDLGSVAIDALAAPAFGFRHLQLAKRGALPVYEIHAKTVDELRRECSTEALQTLSTARCLSRSVSSARRKVGNHN